MKELDVKWALYADFTDAAWNIIVETNSLLLIGTANK